MASGKKFYKRPKFITLIIALLIAAVAVPTTLALTARQAKNLDVQVEGEEEIEGIKDKLSLGEREWTQMLQKLRANDAKFNNAKLSYTQSYTKTVKHDPFHFIKFGDDPSRMPKDFWEPRKYRLVNDCWLVVRGDDAVLSTQYEPTPLEKYKYTDCRQQYQKYGNLSGFVYRLSDMQLENDDPYKNKPNYEKQLRIRELKSPLAGLHDIRMAIEFVHGIGFGKRIKEISAVRVLGDRKELTGIIRIWSDDISKFKIEIDSDLLVRNAIIDCNVKGSHTRFEVSTQGTIKKDGLRLAKSGTFKRLRMPSSAKEKEGTKPSVQDDYHVQFKNTDMNLTGQRYAELTRFEIEPLMQVDDYARNIHVTGAAYYEKVKEYDEEKSWGEAVEGLAVRLRAKGATTAKRVTLLADARNDGPGTYRGTRSTHGCWLKVDGKWYWRVKTLELVAPMLLKAGDRQLAFTQVRLSSEKSHLWRGGISTNDGLVSPPLTVTVKRYQSDKPLELSPGRHTVRLAFPASRKAYAYSNAVEIEILPAEEKPAEHVDRKKVWGQAVNGLRAAVEFEPEKESYDLEERVGVRFHIQNVSNEDVQFSSLSGSRKGQYWPTVKDSDGKEVKVDTWESLGTWSYLHHIIKPGQILTLKNTGLIFSDFHDSALLDKPKWVGIASVVRCGPGQYSIYYKVSRTLETGVRKVTVNERPPVNPRSFELMLDQQSMLQAVQTLRRKYRVRICFEQVGSESGRKQHLLTGTFFAPTIPELLDKLTETGLYKWEKFYRTYAVYPKQNSLLRFSVKTDISDSPFESVARVILDQDPRGKQIEIEAVYKGRMRWHLWISKASAMYALSGATARASISNSDVVWTLTLNQGVPHLYLHRLSQAPQTNEQIKADMPDEKDQLAWGEAAEGVQCRLRAEKIIWQSGKWPKFQVDLRNHGERKLYRSGAPEYWEIELDGVWYRAAVFWGGTVGMWPLFPGKEQTNILVPLQKGLKWQSKEGKQPLEFRAGKHTVRFALRLSSADEGRSLLSVVSNPVEITIERALPGSGLSIDKAIKEKAAFAAVCEAVAKFIPTTALSPRRDPFDTLSQEFKVVEVLFGKAEAVDRVKLDYKYIYKEPECERAIRKHERVIWIGHTRNMSFHGSLYGLKALPDTPENRQAVRAAASQAATAWGEEVNGKQDSPLQKFIRQYSKQKIVCLDIGEQYTFRSHNGIEKLIRLASVKDYRDKVLRMVRRAEVVVVVNGKTVRLICEPYTMPTVIDGLRIQADTTSGWRNITKRVQLSIWDANDPIVDTRKFCFPIKRYLLFSHGLQAYNEVRHLGLRDGNPGHTAYHDYGIDLGGYDGGEDVVSCCSGQVVSLWPKSGMARSVSVQDEGGLIWLHTHLDSVAANIAEGVRVSAGQRIGVLGKKGHSGNFSHLHLGTSLTRADLTANRFCRRLNLYPWIVTAFQEKYGRNLYAVARPHQVVFTGEKVIFDGSKSMAYDAKIVDYRWVFDNGNVVRAVKAEKVFDKPGVYVGTLRVRDEQGNEDVDFCRVKVFTRDAPEDNIATIYMTHTPTLGISEGQDVLFQFWIQGGKEEPISIDFGDGATLSDYLSYQEVRHKFDRQGIYIITATANVNGLPIMGKQRVVVESTAGRYLPAHRLHRTGFN